MDRERFEQLKQKENEILRGRPVGGVVNGYGADNGLTPEQTIGFINKQSAADEDWKAAKAFYNGSVNQLERGILGTLAMIKDNNIASLQAQGIAVGDGGKYIDMALNSEHLQPYEVKGKTALGQFGLDLASGAGQLVSQAALALTTGGVGSTVAMGASIAGNQYADLRKEGVSVERATNASLINAAVQAPLERLSIGNILSKLPAGSGMRQKAIQIAQNAVTEGVTEYAQQYPEEITNLYAKSGGNLEELANATIDKLPEIHQNALYAGAIGALLGGGAGTINVALQRNMNAAQLEAVEGRVEQAKQIGITPEAYANTVNNNLPDSNVSVDGDVLLKFMQSGKTEEIAQSLGVTVNKVQQAADEGLTVEIRQGNYEGTAMKYADFMPAVRDYSAFEVNGFMQSDTQGQKELQKEYQQFTDNEEEFQAYKDEKIAEMQAAGINQQEALNAMILLESRARVYNPDNPLAFFEAYPIEFRRGTDGGELNQAAAMYKNNAKDILEFKENVLSGKAKKTYFEVPVGNNTVRITDDEVRHIQNGHKLKDEEWQEILQNIDNVKQAAVVPDNKKPRGKTVAMKITTPENKLFGVVMEFADNGNIYLKTAFKSTDEALDDWINKRGAAVRWLTAPANRMPDGNGNPAISDSHPLSISIIQQSLLEGKEYNQSAGVHARTANRELLNEAQAMAAEGKMQREIYEKTGWRRGADGNWRFEIPDNLDKIDIKKLQSTKQFFSLAEIYDNEKLYAAYPFLREVTIQKEKLDGNRLGYSEGDYLIVIDSDVDEWFTPGTIIHELQHIIQNYEGFASGGNTRQVRTLVNEAIRKKTEEARSLAPHATMYYNRRREYEMAMIMGDEARMKELEGPIKKLEQEIPNKARRDRIYKLFSEADSLLRKANNMSDKQLYINLYGEKEARAAEEKARISTRMERNRQKGNTQYDEILRDYTERLPEELQPVAKEYVDLIKQPLAERDFDKETEIEEKLLDNEIAGEFYNKISDSQWEAAGTGELQKEYDETVFLPEKADAVVIFNDNLVASYNENTNEGNRGSIWWNNDGAAIVELFSAADASTFIHESIGHYFANVLAKEAVLPGANEQTVKDFETMLNYAGTTRERWEYLNSKSRPALTKDEDKELVKIQETWATAAEQYILEGKAPNRELQPVFNRFKKWLLNVYKTIESFVKNNQYAVPITDEVRQVFGRMLASEQQISEMEKLNGYYAKLPKAITDNLSDAYKTRLYDAMAKAHDKAVQLLTRKSLENFTAERKEQIAEYRADMRPKVAAQVDNEPLYRAEKEAADMITSGGKQAKTIARRYIDSNAQEYKDWKSELDRVQSDINSRLDPIIQALEAGMGNGVAKVRDDATGRYIRISNNDPWYSDFYKTYKRRPTKAELRDMAYKIYVGEGYNLLPDSVARNAEEEAAYAELKEDIDGLMEYEEELLSYKGEMEQYKGKGLSDEDAYTFNMLAEEYGFSSGDDLAKAILESPTRQQAIKQRLDDEVQKKFPDIYKERRLAEATAQEAFYNDDTGAVLGLEEQIIEDAAKRTLDQQRNAEQQRQLAQMKRQQAKVQAQGYLRSVPLREALRIQKYITAERRAAANAATALAKGDYETALDYKHKQLLNHAMVQESINMNRRYTQYGKFLNRQRKLKKESWNNEENFMQVGALFARMGLRLRGYDARLKQQSLKEWADAMQADYDNVAIPDWVYDESKTFTRPLSDLTFDEYEDVVNTLKNIKAVVKAQTMMEGEAKAKTFAETKAEGMAVLEKKPTKYTPDVNEKGKASAFAKFKRQLRNSDNFFEMIDGWTYGWYSKFFGETVRKAADVEAELTMQYEDATRQAYKEWLPDKAARKAASVKVKYDELGTSATKHTLIYMALNLGNESNAAKLCSTAVNSTFREFFPQSQLWVEGDVIQTKKNLLEFLGKNLTAADWRYVQKKIDIANMFWTQMSELERRDKGFAPPKVEAYPEIITLADGQQIVYRGGYFPLIRRRDTGSHPASQDAIPATTGGRPGDSIRTLHTNTGHTKARDNSVYPIDLTGGGEYAVAMDTIHDIAFREPMNNFRKLMNDREFYNMLKSKLGIADMEALEEFLKKAAQPYGGSGFATLSERDTGKFMSWLRNKTVNAAIMLNFKTSLQNLGNPLLYGRVVDGFGYADVLAAYANYQKNWQGRKGFHAMRDFVYGKSVFMRERGQLPDISLRDMKDEGAELNPIEKRTIKWGAQMLTFTDNLSALPVWLQAYQKKINAKASEQEAIQFADTVIRRTLGSSRITDVAPMQRGGPLMKLFTTFQGFFNTQYNQWNREFNIVTRLIKEGSYGTAAGRVTAFAAAKFLLFNLINLALAFEDPLGDDDDDGWSKIATELLHYPISLLGWTGGIANATLNNMLDIKDYGYNMTAIEGSLDKLFKAGKLVDDIADGDKDVEEAVEPVAGVATMAAGIPNQLNKLFFNAWDILYNDMDAEWRDLFYRRPSRDR